MYPMGAPVLPGAMSLISYYNTVNNKTIPVLGLPGCVMYAKRTVFDLVLPRILAGQRLTPQDISTNERRRLVSELRSLSFPQLWFWGIMLKNHIWQFFHMAKIRDPWSRVCKLRKERLLWQGLRILIQNGNATMVDVTAKADTERIAVATGYIQVNEEVFDAGQNQTAKKGDVLGAARIAGNIMAAKKTSDRIPMCHPLMLTKVTVDC